MIFISDLGSLQLREVITSKSKVDPNDRGANFTSTIDRKDLGQMLLSWNPPSWFESYGSVRDDSLNPSLRSSRVTADPVTKVKDYDNLGPTSRNQLFVTWQRVHSQSLRPWPCDKSSTKIGLRRIGQADLPPITLATSRANQTPEVVMIKLDQLEIYSTYSVRLTTSEKANSTSDASRQNLNGILVDILPAQIASTVLQAPPVRSPGRPYALRVWPDSPEAALRSNFLSELLHLQESGDSTPFFITASVLLTWRPATREILSNINHQKPNKSGRLVWPGPNPSNAAWQQTDYQLRPGNNTSQQENRKDRLPMEALTSAWIEIEHDSQLEPPIYSAHVNSYLLQAAHLSSYKATVEHHSRKDGKTDDGSTGDKGNYDTPAEVDWINVLPRPKRGDENGFLVQGLNFSAVYIFRVIGITEAGLSPPSPISPPVYTPFFMPSRAPAILRLSEESHEVCKRARKVKKAIGLVIQERTQDDYANTATVYNNDGRTGANKTCWLVEWTASIMDGIKRCNLIKGQGIKPF
ncbi:unnamed protein product [Protopolystoma xenopodis]|uniref:Fibronectin type-III domain-containing protein n=1 Tax=Protopolystoma xenopodis TaxID=117903 RepID=A0A3S4ZZX1_9PLAT|nr:unnamed protein product [Protopolystoma xenopodis]